jgi:hypothetical protein
LVEAALPLAVFILNRRTVSEAMSLKATAGRQVFAFRPDAMHPGEKRTYARRISS